MISAEGGICAGENKTLKFSGCSETFMVAWSLIINGEVVSTSIQDDEYTFTIPDEPYQVSAFCCSPDELANL